jgi:hypothetical protein
VADQTAHQTALLEVGAAALQWYQQRISGPALQDVIRRHATALNPVPADLDDRNDAGTRLTGGRHLGCDPATAGDAEWAAALGVPA